MIGRKVDSLLAHRLEASLNGPRTALLGPRPDFHAGATRCRGIVVPAHDRNLTAWLQASHRLVKENQWFFSVADVEEHDVACDRIRQPAPQSDEVSLVDPDVREPLPFSRFSGRDDHPWVDVKSMDGA